jgi:hypothetical protein
MARLLLALKSTYPSVITSFNALKSEFFQKLITATKIISGYSGYDENIKNFRAPSLAFSKKEIYRKFNERTEMGRSVK